MPTLESNISSLLTSDTIVVGGRGGDHFAVIDRLVDLLSDDPRVLEIERVRKAVHEREDQMSTAVGVGLALPHARTEAVSGTVASFAVTADAVDFQTPDEVPVRLVFLLVGPRTDVSRHVRILSRLSRLMQREALRSRLLEARSSAEAHAAFEAAEMALLAG